MNNLTRLFKPLLILFLPMSMACSPADKKEMDENVGEKKPLPKTDQMTIPRTSFNEENWSTDYSNIQVSIGEIHSINEEFVVEVKVNTTRENYHIEILGNLSDEKGNIAGARTDSFYGPDSFEHTYRFEKMDGFDPHLILLSIYNPIDGNWNDLKFTYFDGGKE